MVALWLIVPDVRRRRHLAQILTSDPDLNIVGSDPAVAALPNGMGQADVFIVDLASDHICLPQFWATLHVLNPQARLMALIDTPIPMPALAAALQAGACYLVAWQEPPERIVHTAYAAGRELGFVPRGAVLEAMLAFFDQASKVVAGWRFGSLVINRANQSIERDGQVVPLTRHEYDLLVYLASNAGRVVPLGELATAVWHQTAQQTHLVRHIKHAISRLRKKVEPQPGAPSIILNKRGEGYYLPRPPAA
ncbi:MAG: response regulator transcription factor [Anaerolineales bacterium]|nr:response regulator transcription factor [Anaerolineales bacterium]